MASVERRDTSLGVRYDVRWRLPDGTGRKRTFRRREDAEGFVKKLNADEVAGLLSDPNLGEVRFDGYAKAWIATRLVKGKPLAPATVQGYRDLLRRNLNPTLGPVPLRKITPERVREWHAALIETKGADQAAKSYRLLRAVLNTAVDDNRIGRNPCRIKGAGEEVSGERPTVPMSMVFDLADLSRARVRAMVLLAGFGGLRTGESLGLRRRDIDPLRRVVRVTQQAQEITGRGRIVKPPKSEAGRREVVMPKAAMEALEEHLAVFTAADPDAVVFVAPGGTPLRRASWSDAWREAVWLAGAPAGLKPHDLRHHAATLMAQMPGVTLRELMARIGHSSMRAAIRYQHATEERDRAIAAFIDTQIEASRTAPRPTPIRRPL